MFFRQVFSRVLPGNIFPTDFSAMLNSGMFPAGFSAAFPPRFTREYFSGRFYLI
jgi:hypothetical protein